MDEEERLFNQAFGEHTGIYVDCREDIRFIKNNVEGARMFRLKFFDARAFTNLAWRLLGQYISNDTLDEFDLDGCDLTDQQMASLFSELVRSPLSELDIRNNSFGIDGVRCMIPFLENSPNLSVIDLSRNNNINSECFEVLIKALRGRPIRTLRLWKCNITDISALEIYSLPNLQKLNLMENNIGREGGIVLSNMLQKEDTMLEALYLDNTGIDEGTEILVNSLKHNTKLNSLTLKENNITMGGYVALLKLLNNISSIENTYNSNNVLTTLKLGHHDKKSGIIGKINSVVRKNKNSPNSHAAGRAKVIKYQLNSQIRKKMCEFQGVEYSAEDNNVLADIEPKLLPTVLALIGTHHGQSEFYTSLMPIVPDLMSFIDRRAMIENEKGRNASHSSALNAEYEHKMAALTAEYEQKMASLKTHFWSETSRLTAKDIDLNNRLALIELGDSK